MAGKGDVQRPRVVGADVFAERWRKTFGETIGETSEQQPTRGATRGRAADPYEFTFANRKLYRTCVPSVCTVCTDAISDSEEGARRLAQVKARSGCRCARAP